MSGRKPFRGQRGRGNGGWGQPSGRGGPQSHRSPSPPSSHRSRNSLRHSHYHETSLERTIRLAVEQVADQIRSGSPTHSRSSRRRLRTPAYSRSSHRSRTPPYLRSWHHSRSPKRTHHSSHRSHRDSWSPPRLLRDSGSSRHSRTRSPHDEPFVMSSKGIHLKPVGPIPSAQGKGLKQSYNFPKPDPPRKGIAKPKQPFAESESRPLVDKKKPKKAQPAPKQPFVEVGEKETSPLTGPLKGQPLFHLLLTPEGSQLSLTTWITWNNLLSPKHHLCWGFKLTQHTWCSFRGSNFWKTSTSSGL